MLRAFGGMFTTVISSSQRRRSVSQNYPDHWAPSALQPETKRAEHRCTGNRRMETTVTLDKTSDLPERARLREQEDLTRRSMSPVGGRYGAVTSNPPRAAPSGANTMPLGPTARKRNAPDVGQELKSFKLRKTDDILLSGTTAVHDSLVVDLTRDGSGRCSPLRAMTASFSCRELVIRSRASNNRPSGCPSANDTVTTTSKIANAPTLNPYSQYNSSGVSSIRPTTSGAYRRRRQAEAAQKQLAESATTKAFKKVQGRLLACQQSMKLDRAALSDCWEVDERLKGPGSMDRLQKLSKHMMQIEEGLAEAIGVVLKLL